MRKYIIAGVLCLSLVLGACSSGNSPKEEKTEQTTEKTEQVEETERDVDVKKKEYQPKLDVIEPSAYNNADGAAAAPETASPSMLRDWVLAWASTGPAV